ncbi:sulfate adenylyltransferase [Aeromonas caviae]|jgi:predicted transglutaminase-like cysteine proteinase|nr:sulfate adenylyltransferase [Aeromonas caviae]GJA30469.1 sulfate adenylyltransferase [Aeromonas caviae]GJA34904.1 sulfate adenylyltransferase [Aeromonas caviae]GJA39334.1 sulfate adenylyltransferase [Aeromonas caviae]GJA75201.1 sulfate adenylyltransferase [Aeromonas caviae]
MQAVYGARAIQRSEAFSRLLTPRAGTTDQQKLELVNNYFNNLTYSEDPRLWGDDDYWANPLEFIGARGGDCEDYSIAKYYTLMELGVDEKKLRLAYVKAIRYNQFHMVTLYFPTIKSDPLVLDNINGRILPGSKRNDLQPVYSFDAKSIWIMKSRREGTLAGSADRLAQWTSMQSRFSSEHLRSPRRQL